MPSRPMANSVRPAAFSEPVMQAKNDSAAPASMTGPSAETPAAAANSLSADGLVDSASTSPLKPTSCVYADRTYRTPAKAALPSTARGTMRCGSRASTPSELTDSKPTKPRIARTIPSATPETVKSAGDSGAVLSPSCASTMTRTSRIEPIDTTSSTSPIRVDSWMPRTMHHSAARASPAYMATCAPVADTSRPAEPTSEVVNRTAPARDAEAMAA